MKLTDKQAQSILDQLNDDDLLDIYMELNQLEEPIVNTYDYISELIDNTEPTERIQEFIQQVQGNSNFDAYANYTALRIYNDDVTSADNIRDLFSDGDWVYTIGAYFADYVEDSIDIKNKFGSNLKF